MKVKTVVIPIGVLALGFIAMMILFNLKSEPPKRTPQIRPRMVQAEIVRLQENRAPITALGRLASAQPLVLFSEVNGTMQEGDVPFKPATLFKKGDLLVKIDDRQARLELNSMKSDFLNALAAVLPEIKLDFPDEYEKYQKYFDDCGFDCRLEPLPETDNQKIKLFLTRFNVYKLFYSVKNLEIRLEKHFFYAPFGGTIVSAELRVGSTVRAGNSVGQIINLENLEVEVPIPAVDLPWIDQNEAVLFTSSELPGEWRGKIKRIGKAIDERTQTIPVYLSIEDDRSNQLITGIFLKAALPGKVIPNSLQVPNRAIYNERFVYRIRDGKLDFREVEVARRESATVIITNGLENGDTLVTEVLQGVAAGMPAMARIAETAGGS
jgi:membrane fusion protein, multidrug efflux system